MKKSRHEWKVGLFVLLGLVVLGALLLQFSKGTTFFRGTYNILLRASNVGGLKIRSTVLMAGVQVGTVSEIKLGPAGTNVTITLKIYSQYQIHKDARFIIEQSGFLGDQYVAISPTKNEAELFVNGEVATADAPFNLQEVARSAGGFLQRIEETVSKLNLALEDVRRFALNEETLTNLSQTIYNLRTVSEKAVGTLDDLSAVVTSNAPALSQSGSNLVVFSRQINEFASSLKDLVETNRPAINSAVSNIEASTVTLRSAMDDLQSGKGVAGKILKDDALAGKVDEIVENLSVTTSNLNRLGVWGILWKKKPTSGQAPSERRDPARNLGSPKGKE